MSALPQRKTSVGMSIGSILEKLRPDFPDVTVSKIRFLEAEGLITPERTSSGYRRFTGTDHERLRFILTAQRDHYLPLRVIKKQLLAFDEGRSDGASLLIPKKAANSAAANLQSNSSAKLGLTREELLHQADVPAPFFEELLRDGMVKPVVSGFFRTDAVTLVQCAWALSQFGLTPRHLRAFKTAANREAGLIAHIAEPVAKSREPGAWDRAQEVVQEVASLCLTLHASLIKAAISEVLEV